MKLYRLAAAFVLAVSALPVMAEDTGAVIGKVDKIYVRESANFFIEKSLLRRPRNQEQWSEVRFAEPLADGRKSELVRLPDSVNVERGDLVSAQLADKRDTLPGLIPEVNRMVSVVAKHDTLAAIMYDLPKPMPGAVLPFVQALKQPQ